MDPRTTWSAKGTVVDGEAWRRRRSGWSAGRPDHLRAVPIRDDAPASTRSLAELRARYDESRCRCTHSREAHDHFRRGTDCALCTCVRYLPASPAWAIRRRA